MQNTDKFRVELTPAVAAAARWMLNRFKVPKVQLAVEDVAQNYHVRVAMLASRGRVVRPHKVEKGVLLNVIREMARRESRSRRDRLVARSDCSTPSPVAKVLDRERARLVREALDRLPKQMKEVVLADLNVPSARERERRRTPNENVRNCRLRAKAHELLRRELAAFNPTHRR